MNLSWFNVTKDVKQQKSFYWFSKPNKETVVTVTRMTNVNIQFKVLSIVMSKCFRKTIGIFFSSPWGDLSIGNHLNEGKTSIALKMSCVNCMTLKKTKLK